MNFYQYMDRPGYCVFTYMTPKESKASQERLCLYRCCDNSFIIIIITNIFNTIIIINVNS